MKFRPQRGSLEESMLGVVTLDSTLKALAGHLNADVGDIKVNFYMYDSRIDWYTYIVTVDGDAVGFTDGDIKTSPPRLPCGPADLRRCQCLIQATG